MAQPTEDEQAIADAVLRPFVDLLQHLTGSVSVHVADARWPPSDQTDNPITRGSRRRKQSTTDMSRVKINEALGISCDELRNAIYDTCVYALDQIFGE